MKRNIALTLTGALILIVLPSTSALAAKNPYGTATIDPAGPNEIILTISSKRHRTDFALVRLKKIHQTSLTIYEPFVKKRQNFSVIPLKNLFALGDIKPSDYVITKALNDYLFVAKASDFITAEGYLAIALNGEAIPYDQGGPIRIIYPDNSKWRKNLDAWNWSLRTISVK